MNIKEKNIEKRQQVFKIMDDLNEKGERINADKIARIAKMGKQTVLPFYNEWRMFEHQKNENNNNIPEDLLRSLKKILTDWKFKALEDIQKEQEIANNEIDQLMQKIEQLDHDNIKLQKTNNEQLTMNHALENQFRESTKQYKILETQSIRQQEKIIAMNEVNQLLNAQLEQQKKEHKKNISELETNLNHRFDQELNHWIKKLDDERIIKTDLEKQLQKIQKQHALLQQQNDEKKLQISQLNHTNQNIVKERDKYQQHNNTLIHKENIIQSTLHLLDVKEDKIIASISNLIKNTQILETLQHSQNQSQQQIKSLQHQIKNNEIQLQNIHQLEKQIEKQTGIIETLKITQNTKEQKTS